MDQPSPSVLDPTRQPQLTDPCFSNKFWTREEDHHLFSLVTCTANPDWSEISKSFPDKSEFQVEQRWVRVLDPSLLKGLWRPSEDQTIMDFVAHNGTKSWAQLSQLLPGRTGKQCRERWFNNLRPMTKRGPWTSKEDKRLMELHAEYGNRWTKISKLMPNRSDNAIKNRWHSALSRRSEFTVPAPPARPLLPSIALLVGGAPTIKDLESLRVGAGLGIPELQTVQPTRRISLQEAGALAVERE
jgi:hypothetical protein